MNIYYVYAYLRMKDLTPYYIGKGKKKRAYGKHNVTVPRDRSMIVFLETNLTEIGALSIERRMIRWYGRKDLGTGILRNLTDGGEGASGAIRSEKFKKSVSKRFKGRASPTKGSIAWNRGIPMASDAKEKSSNLLKGRAAWNAGIPASAESNLKRKKNKPAF